MSNNPMKDVRIVPAINGWIVRVGCASLVALSKEMMLHEISRYIDNPREVEKEYAASAVNQGTYTPDVDGPRPERVEADGRVDESASDERAPR